MYARRPRGNRDGVAGLGPQDFARRGDELRQNQRRGGGARRLEVLPRGGERALERPGEREAREPGLQGLQAASVGPGRDGARRGQPLRRAQDQPEREQAVALRAARRRTDQHDQTAFGGGRGLDHATRRATAAATSAAAMSRRQRWWPSGQVAVPEAEQGRQSRSRCSTAAGPRYGKKPNCPTVGPNSATTGVPTPVAMCITPVSPETSARARASSAPVSCSENSPAALSICPPRVPPPPPPASASSWASPRSSGPPSTTGRDPAGRSRSASAIQWARGQRLVAGAAPGATAIKGASASARCASHSATRSRAPWLRQNSGGPPSGRVSSARAASK